MAVLLEVVFTLVLLGSIGSKPVDGAFRFTQKPNDPSYFEKGTNATLVWDYSVDNRQAELQGIIWSVIVGSTFVPMLIKEGDAVAVPHNSIPSTYKGRVHIEGKATLVIVNITLQDSTTFLCRLSAKAGSGLSDVDSDVRLVVTEHPSVSLFQQVVVSNAGDNANFTCNATGIPAPNITWVRQLDNNETVVLHSSPKYEITSASGTYSQLTIKNIISRDHGYYQCKAAGFGFDVEKAFLGVPHLNARQGSAQLSSIKATLGHLVTLDCPVIGFPQPEVTWTLPNGSVVPNRLASTLPVILKTVADFGDYTCSAKSLDRTIPHFIISIQNAVSPLNSNVTNGGPAVVRWYAVLGAEYYFVKITGDNVHDDAQLGRGNEDSITIHFHTLVLKADKEVKEVQITVQVFALNDYELLAKGERLDATVSGSVALHATILHLCVVLVQMLSG